MTLFTPIDEVDANQLQTTEQPEAVTQRIQRPVRLGTFSITTKQFDHSFLRIAGGHLTHAILTDRNFKLRHEAHILVLEPLTGSSFIPPNAILTQGHKSTLVLGNHVSRELFNMKDNYIILLGMGVSGGRAVCA